VSPPAELGVYLLEINQFISLAVGEKMSSLLTEEYLVKRSKKGNLDTFLNAMSKIPDVKPEIYDKL